MQPGVITHGVPPDSLAAAWVAIKDLQRMLREITSGNAGQAMQVGAGGILVDGGGEININGGGAAYVNGLELSAVKAASITAWASNYAVPTTQTTVVSTVVPVPTGFTSAIVFVNGEVEFANNQTFTVTVQGMLSASATSGSITSNGPGLDIPVDAGATNTMTATLAAVCSGISPTAGQSITISGQVTSGNALSVNAYNAYGITGVAIFLA